MSFSDAVDTVAYPFRSVGNIAAGAKIDPKVNRNNTDIRELNKDFSNKEDEITFLVKNLIENSNSSIKNFNSYIVFPKTKELDDNLRVFGTADWSGEFVMEREKLLITLEKIMMLYNTPHTKFDNLTDDPDHNKNYLKLYENIKPNLNNISTTYTHIQPFIDNNKQKKINDYKKAINEHFDIAFLKKYSIIQYLNLLIRLINCFISEIDQHIAYFEQRDKTSLQKIYDYSVGLFTWMARSGYSYENTANFLIYFKENNIEKKLKKVVTDEIKKLTNSISILEDIRLKHKRLNNHILENVTDEFVIDFEYNDEIKNISISLGDITIDNYQNLCNLITEKVNSELIKENVSDIDFIIYHQNKDKGPILKNYIYIESNKQFTLKQDSSVMKILGWGFNDSKSQNRLNSNNEIIGRFLGSKIERKNEELDLIIPYSARHHTMVTTLGNFNRTMNIQRTIES